MKVKVTCPLPKEIPIGILIIFIGVALALGCIYGLSWLGTNVVPVVLPSITFFVSFILSNLGLGVAVIILLVIAGIGFASESESLAIYDRTFGIVIYASLIATLSFMYALFVGANLQNGTEAITLSDFLTAFIPMECSFLAGWVAGWIQRCVKIERGA